MSVLPADEYSDFGIRRIALDGLTAGVAKKDHGDGGLRNPCKAAFSK